MTTTPGLYDTYELMTAIRQVARPPDTFWLDLYPNTFQSQVETIFFDQIEELRRMAVFTAPGATARVSEIPGFGTNAFRPAYTKPKHEFNPEMAFHRLPGEGFGGTMSPQQRADAIILDYMAQERNQIIRLWDWMAAQATMNGSVVISGEDYPTRTVSFGRDSSLAVTLLTTERWSQTTGTPLDDIEEMRQLCFAVGRTRINKLIMGLAAWRYFISFTSVRDMLKTDMRASNSTLNLATGGDGADRELRGFLGGPNGEGFVEIWTYNGGYDDADGTSHDILDTNTVIGVGPALNGYKCFGAIRHGRQLLAESMFPRTWETTDDPVRVFTQTQSAPLMVPVQPNASFKLKVH